MAINVFLVFFFRASPDSFRRWWWVYCIVCYGGPFIIALSLLFVRKAGRGPVYGGATVSDRTTLRSSSLTPNAKLILMTWRCQIWCWVDREWDEIRIYTYYMLIWICIAGSLLFYSMVGYHVFHTRNQLRSLSTSKNRDGGNMAEVCPLSRPCLLSRDNHVR